MTSISQWMRSCGHFWPGGKLACARESGHPGPHGNGDARWVDAVEGGKYPTSESVEMCPRCGVPLSLGHRCANAAPTSKQSTMRPLLTRLRDRPKDHLLLHEAAAEIERLTAALAACQTYDYRTLADEVERLEKALALQVEQEAANWRRGEDERNRLRAALVNAEAVMTIVEPRSDKAEYLACLAQIRQCLGFETSGEHLGESK